ncbi:MAG: N-alpha-acetyl diaminobutyric acid deacetylase DoeB [Proteobacteria bacterium]|nr:N-alpha-acetyl diaminobutyric acid deacetylase DoeB [Pseudomonadota bacterium]
MKENPISCSLDFNKQGIQHGFLRLPHSRNDSAWGAVMIPVTVMKNGEGPTALLSGGNHGDEYEGPIALLNFARQADIQNIQGRIIIIPAMNYPAFQVAHRVSPIDGINLNRAFPGRPDGSITEIIADYFSRTLLPLAEYVLDIHSGGKTLEFVPFSACHQLEDKTQEAKCEAAMRAFSAPFLLKMLELDAGGMYDTQAEKMGKIFVSTELGGGGTTRLKTISVAKRGVDNFLRHAGILDGEIEPSPEGSDFLHMPDASCFLISEHNGLVEPCIDLGMTVKKGELMARVHITERTAMVPYEYFAPRDGLVIARHVPSLIKMGDCMNVIANVVR